MATFVKYTNGGVSFLVNINDQVEMDEKEAAHFVREVDEDGEFVTVDSMELVHEDNEKTNEIIESMKRKAAKKLAETSKVTLDKEDGKVK